MDKPEKPAEIDNVGKVQNVYETEPNAGSKGVPSDVLARGSEAKDSVVSPVPK